MSVDFQTEQIVRRMYLDLMKKCLSREILPEHFRRIPRNDKTWWRSVRSNAYGLVNRALGTRGFALVQAGVPDGETMIGMARLDNLQECITDILENDVPGDLIETGVWRGGATIFMKAVLAAYGDTTRTVWLADSFRGLPRPDEVRYPADRGDRLWTLALDTGVEMVRGNFTRYGLLDDRVRFLEGWFKDTLPSAPIDRLSLLRLDGDLYESTIQALDALYPKLSAGGYCIVDDYGAIPACRQAVEDYRSTHGITEPIKRIDETGVFWKRQQ
ncbi:MAG TPA: TylF/MycF/NovP-related O-methyltransferase [Longimicrobiaceae bacterium]|nr:TylF/MycF/NovP-related O-methyltransferase [Longimicrobiaceae bacterium]